MFDSLGDGEQVKSHTGERLRLAAMVVLIAVILFAVLYFAAQKLGKRTDPADAAWSCLALMSLFVPVWAVEIGARQSRRRMPSARL